MGQGMADNLSELWGKLLIQQEAKARWFKRASLFVKIALVAIFSAVAGVAQFAQFPAAGPTAWQIIGITASSVVAIGAVFVVLTDQDASVEMALAAKALEEARAARTEYEVIDELEADRERLIELFQSVNLMRGVIEQATHLTTIDEDGLVKSVLTACQRSLAIAMDFSQSDQWTIAVYKAIPDPDEVGKTVLKCTAHKRAIECDIANARLWKEGTGIMGVAFSSGDEIVVPDLQADGTRAVFSTSANETRGYDNQRYRSMVAVPILVVGLQKPWGVVTATSDRVGHFKPDAQDGLRNDEGARALAAMIALAVAVQRNSLPK
jgi:hypothetical protein